MLCPNCKKEIAENTQICPGCGAQVNPAPANTPTEKQKNPGNILLSLTEHQGFEGKNHHQRHSAAYKHIGGCMYTHIHPGKRHKDHKCKTHTTDDLILLCRGNTAKGTHSGLRVAAGKAVTAGLRDRLFQRMEIGISHPGTGYATKDLQKLIGHIAKKAHTKKL